MKKEVSYGNEISSLKDRAETLEKIVKDIFWMARRYAHGRHTAAPSTVRDAYHELCRLGIKIEKDKTIAEDGGDTGRWLKTDYLFDINL